MPHPQGSARESVQSLQDDGARLEYARPSLPIPEELLREILHYIVPGPSFSTGECRKMDAALSQTCRLFASVAIPRLFHDLHVHCHSDSDDITPGWLQLVRTGYLDDLLNVSRIASLVQSVRLTSQGFDVPKVGSAIDSLLLLPRLTSMTLDYITVPGRVLNIIAQMKTLRTLSFMECSFLEADRERIRSYATELIVFKCHGYPFEGWAMTEDGMEGPVRAGTLRLLRVTHPTLGGTIIPRCGTFPKLEEVEIHLGKDPLLIGTLRGLLEEIPTLKILRLINCELAPPSLLDIKANLPRLSVVACPAWMLSLMGPLHAISILDIGPPLLDTSADLLECLAARDLFAQLKELSLDSRLLPLAGSALKSARRIVVLAIKVVVNQPAFDDIVTLIVDALGAVPMTSTLRTLRLQLVGHGYPVFRKNHDLPIQHETVRRISRSAPQLDEISIGETFTWIAERTRRGPAADLASAVSWTPRCIDRDNLDRMMHSPNGSLMNFGEYLHKIF